ncbi:MAG: abortive infection system toxin AbiGii family protein, partial [Clostridiaceae bacterium]
LDGNVEFEYILLRTQEILEDCIIVVSNREQEKCPFKISMRINVAEKKTDFNINIEELRNKNLLQYVRFMKKASGGANLAIRLLPTGQNLMEGTLNQFKYKSGFETTDEEIAFLEKVVLIEDYFGKPIILPDEICTDDYDIIYYISELINGERHN